MIRLEHVTVEVEGRRIIDDVSFEVKDGDFTAFLAPGEKLPKPPTVVAPNENAVGSDAFNGKSKSQTWMLSWTLVVGLLSAVTVIVAT